MYIQQKPHLLVFAKHDGCNKEFLFAVPCDMEVRKGDVLLVETMYGLTVATATSEVFASINIDEVATKFGAYLPLKEVRQVAGRQIQEYLRRKTISNICNVIQEGLQ